MSTEHTHGPWRLVENMARGTLWVESTNRTLVAIVRTTEPDARLIAAAPDLLAFARRSLPKLIAERDCLYGATTLDGEYPDDEDRMAVEQIDDEIDALRALIARATQKPTEA